MPSYILCAVLFALGFGLLDLAWLSLAGPVLYRPTLGPLLADKVRAVPAALFYLIYVAGVVGFVAGPALQAGDWRQAAVRGAAFAFVAYAAYDLTNHATLRIWSTRITVADLAWGACATAAAAALSVFLTARAAKALGWS